MRALTVAVVVASSTLAGLAEARKPEAVIPRLPLSFAVAPADEAEDGVRPPVQDAAWIDAQVAKAEALFGVHGVHFDRVGVRPLDARFAHLETRADRDALKEQLEKGVVNVFVVSSLRDVDDPSLFRMGVHWRPQGQVPKHYVIVAASARETTLAHELGHFFGNPHSRTVDNLMSYERTGGEVFLDAAQATKIRHFARLYVRIHELLPR